MPPQRKKATLFLKKLSTTFTPSNLVHRYADAYCLVFKPKKEETR